MRIPMDLTEQFRRDQERKELRRRWRVLVIGFAFGCVFTVFVFVAVALITR